MSTFNHFFPHILIVRVIGITGLKPALEELRVTHTPVTREMLKCSSHQKSTPSHT
jgi:hypothetical protein